LRFFFSDSILPEKRQRTYDKCREFFIPHMMQYIISYMVLKDRQMFERGTMIKVGMRWLFGGAQQFAEQMQYTDPDMVYGDGDYDALDTTINRVLLELYVSQAAVYIDKQNSPEYPMFLFFLQLATQNLGVKLVHIFANCWRVMFGVMPSGDFATSHGNSWIVGLLFFIYFEYVMLNNPHRREQMEDCFKNKKVQFPVYGDDHITGIHKSINDILNQTGYAKFVNEFFDMKITKLREDIPFFCVPDGYGGLKTDGTIFLKRRFVKRPSDFDADIVEVLPYKVLDDAIVKFAYGNNERLSVAEYAVACLGLAYDNMGINPVIHNLCEQFFIFLIKFGKIKGMTTLRDAILNNSLVSNRDIMRTLRKIGITTDELLSGFPTRDKLLRMHVMNREYVNFTPPFKRYSAYEFKKWDVSEF